MCVNISSRNQEYSDLNRDGGGVVRAQMPKNINITLTLSPNIGRARIYLYEFETKSRLLLQTHSFNDVL